MAGYVYVHVAGRGPGAGRPEQAAKAKAAPAEDKAAEDSDAVNRSPISSAPQDVVEVGTAEPAMRRTGWWNRG